MPIRFNITRQQILPSLVTLFITSLVGLCAFINGGALTPELVPNESLFGEYISEFQTSHRVWSLLLATIIIHFSALNLGRISARQNLYGQTTYIQIPLLGVLFWSVCLNGDYLLSSLIVALGTQMIGGLMLSVRTNRHYGYLFNAALALSLLPTLYTSAAILWVALPIVLIAVGFTLREWIVSFVGLLLPISIISYIHWLRGEELLFVVESMRSIFLHHSHLFQIETLPLYRVSISGLMLLLSLISLVWISSTTHKSRVRLTASAIVMFTAFATLLSPSTNMLTLALAAPALAILSSLTMIHLPARLANIIYLLLFILLILSMFTPLDLPLVPQALLPQ